MENTKELSNIIKNILKENHGSYVFGQPFDSDQMIDNFSDALAEKLDEKGVVVNNI